jgi:hypothetical protein
MGSPRQSQLCGSYAWRGSTLRRWKMRCLVSVDVQWGTPGLHGLLVGGGSPRPHGRPTKVHRPRIGDALGKIPALGEIRGLLDLCIRARSHRRICGLRRRWQRGLASALAE